MENLSPIARSLAAKFEEASGEQPESKPSSEASGSKQPKELESKEPEGTEDLFYLDDSDVTRKSQFDAKAAMEEKRRDAEPDLAAGDASIQEQAKASAKAKAKAKAKALGKGQAKAKAKAEAKAKTRGRPKSAAKAKPEETEGDHAPASTTTSKAEPKAPKAKGPKSRPRASADDVPKEDAADAENAADAKIAQKEKVKNGKDAVKKAAAGGDGEAAPKSKRQRRPAGEPKATFASRPQPTKEAYAKHRFLCIRESYELHVAKFLTYPSTHED